MDSTLHSQSGKRSHKQNILFYACPPAQIKVTISFFQKLKMRGYKIMDGIFQLWWVGVKAVCISPNLGFIHTEAEILLQLK